MKVYVLAALLLLPGCAVQNEAERAATHARILQLIVENYKNGSWGGSSTPSYGYVSAPQPDVLTQHYQRQNAANIESSNRFFEGINNQRRAIELQYIQNQGMTDAARSFGSALKYGR